MNNDMQMLIKIIIPAVLLLFWLLSSFYNRENNQKTAQSTGMSGNRPANYPSSKPVERRAVPASRSPSQNDEVMIIRAEPTRQPTRPNQQPRKNQNRGRSGGGTQQARKVESTSTSRNRELTGGSLVSDVNHSLTRPIEMRALSDSLATEATPLAATSSRTTGAPPATGLDLRLALRDPTKVREAFILNEVIGPPLSKRFRDGKR